MVLQLSLSGDLTPALAEEGQAIDFITPGGVRVLRYSGLQVNDAEGNLLDAGLAVNGDGVSINIDAASATFPITVDPLLTTPSWTAEGNLADANLGYSVATAGDVNGDGYSDVIVGAYTYSNGESQEGAAYVYHGSAGGLSTAPDWTGEGGQAVLTSAVPWARPETSTATATPMSSSAQRGYSNGESDEGAAFVYYGSASGLGDDGTPATADWKAESNQPWADFGESVGTAGDVNGDGYSDVIIGAWLYDNGQTDEGMAFVYHGSRPAESTRRARWTPGRGLDRREQPGSGPTSAAPSARPETSTATASRTSSSERVCMTILMEPRAGPLSTTGRPPGLGTSAATGPPRATRPAPPGRVRRHGRRRQR